MNPYRHFIGEIEGALKSMQAAGELPEKLDFSAITAEPPRDPAHGDIATNAAMVLSKAAKKKPRDIAEALLPRLKANADVVDGAVAGPGFINLKLRDDFWRARLGECLAEGAAYGTSAMGGGQKVNVEVDFPGRDTVLLAVRANVFKPPEQPGAPTVSAFALPAPASRATGREFFDLVAGDDVDMTGAEFILTIGRGIGEESNVEQFRTLADAVGATLGCSRPIADAGWLPKSRQVGQSGKTASACKLYIAMGVSGAIQHLAGMKHVSTIVAVNSDAEASIFSVAKYGIVGDIFEVAEELRRCF